MDESISEKSLQIVSVTDTGGDHQQKREGDSLVMVCSFMSSAFVDMMNPFTKFEFLHINVLKVTVESLYVYDTLSVDTIVYINITSNFSQREKS